MSSPAGSDKDSDYSEWQTPKKTVRPSLGGLEDTGGYTSPQYPSSTEGRKYKDKLESYQIKNANNPAKLPVAPKRKNYQKEFKEEGTGNKKMRKKTPPKRLQCKQCNTCGKLFNSLHDVNAHVIKIHLPFMVRSVFKTGDSDKGNDQSRVKLDKPNPIIISSDSEEDMEVSEHEVKDSVSKNEDGKGDTDTSAESDMELPFVDITPTDSNSKVSKEEESVSFLHGNKKLPIYKETQDTFNFCATVQAVIDVPENLLCLKCPSNVDMNAAFVVDTSKLGNKKDINSDDMGSWEQTKTRKESLVIELDTDNGQVSKVKKCKESEPNAYVLTRKWYLCKSAMSGGERFSLKKMIASVQDPQGQVLNNMFIHYFFLNTPKKVIPLPHGNSKSSKSYVRTNASAIDALKKEQMSAKRALFNVQQKAGGLINAESAGAIPRNARQASYHRKQKSSVETHDPIAELVVKYKEQGNDKFIRHIQMVPDPRIVLFTDQQIRDIDRFCASNDAPCIMGIDMTYNIGPYYVTIVTYDHLLLRTDEDVPPVFLGPILVHTSKSEDAYSALFKAMVDEVPQLATKIRCYGTDGEKAIVNAAQKHFPYAVHLRCSNHLKQDLERKCRELGIPPTKATTIIRDIFGTQSSTGLVHCKTKDEFTSKVLFLEEKWEALEKSVGTDKFVKYFDKNIIEILWENARVELFSQFCAPNRVGTMYTQNRVESCNHMIKQYVGSAKLDMLQFTEHIKDCIEEQATSAVNAMIGLGRWELHPGYQFLACDQHTWFTEQTKSTKLDRINRFNTLSYPSILHEPQSVTSTPTPESQEVRVRKTVPSMDFGLSVPIDRSLERKYANVFLEDTWRKAKRLVTDGEVLSAPLSDTTTLWVSSTDLKEPPHVVTVSKQNANRYLCDQRCLAFKQHSFCSHTIAAAEFRNNLQQFVDWLVKSNNTQPNLTTATYHGISKWAGKKGPPRKRQPTRQPDAERQDSIAIQQKNIWQNDEPFKLIKRTKKMKKCISCKDQFPTMINVAPYNIVLEHPERYFYPDLQAMQLKASHQTRNHRYHIDMTCIKKRHPDFTPDKIEISPNVYNDLKPVHFDFLKHTFGCDFKKD